MNQRPNVDIGTISLVAAAKMLGGEVTNGQIRCPVWGATDPPLMTGGSWISVPPWPSY
jgi:hypothetical protein